MPVIDIKTDELEKLVREKKENLEIIDVREQQEYDIVRFKNSRLIPMGEITRREMEIDWNKDIILVCRTGSRSAMIAHMLGNSKKTIMNLEYGLYDYYLNGNKNDLEIDPQMIRVYF